MFPFYYVPLAYVIRNSLMMYKHRNMQQCYKKQILVNMYCASVGQIRYYDPNLFKCDYVTIVTPQPRATSRLVRVRQYNSTARNTG